MDTFQLSLTVLVRYRSREIFRIGGYWPPHSHWISDQRYSGYRVAPVFPSRTRLSLSMAVRSSTLPVGKRGRTPVQTPHPRSLSGRVRFVLFPFRSPLVRESQLVSFPAATKMLQFTASPFARVRANTLAGTMSHSGMPGSKPACGSPGLSAACCTLHQFSSRAIHHAA